MPKQKVHKGLSKRVKVTGSGKVKRRNTNGSHLMSTKSPKLRHKISSASIVEGKRAKTIKKLLCK